MIIKKWLCILIVMAFFVKGKSQTFNDISNKEFRIFLKEFHVIKPPFNYKKELEKVESGSVKLNIINEAFSLKYLGFNSKELTGKRLVYDYETFEKSYVAEQNLPAAHLLCYTENYVLIIYRHQVDIESDSVNIYLKTFKYNGESIDRIKIEEQCTMENDWKSFAFKNDSTFKLFTYTINEENNIKDINGISRIKDEEIPKTVLTIEDFKILESGAISKAQKTSKVLLEEDLIDYKRFNPDNDDPMNNF